jgi:uncharacterized protein (TIGR01777 family)
VLALNCGAVLALLGPRLLEWWQLPTGMLRISHGFSWLFSGFAAGLLVWSVRNAVALLKLRRPPQWVRDPIVVGRRVAGRTILISGATGFIGGHLVRRLLGRGDRVIVFTRNAELALDRFGPHVQIETDLDQLQSHSRIDAIVNLAGAPVLGLPWTRRRRAELVASRVDTTRALSNLMARLEQPVRVFISGSAVGFYGVRGDESLDESARPTQSFQSQLCQEWEATARAAARQGARLVRLRIGLVLGRDGGALPRFAHPARVGLGAILGTGAQWMSWIHIDDLVRLVEFTLDTPRISGAVNAVAPEPVTHREFQTSLGRTLHRPIWLRIPAAPLRWTLGEMAELLLEGQRVLPVRANALGFQFRHRTVTSALQQLLSAGGSEQTPAAVYFNGDCPVCRTEMGHYATLCTRRAPTWRFIDSMQQPDDFAACGLRREHLERRVYLRETSGRILSGVPALLQLWSAMPEYRRLARLLSLPLIRPVCVLFYDHLIAPSLTRWAKRRSAGRRPALPT